MSLVPSVASELHHLIISCSINRPSQPWNIGRLMPENGTPYCCRAETHFCCSSFSLWDLTESHTRDRSRHVSVLQDRQEKSWLNRKQSNYFLPISFIFVIIFGVIFISN